jgi:hypothetical protein
VVADSATEPQIVFRPEYEVTSAGLKEVPRGPNGLVTMTVPLHQLQLLVRSIPEERR